jgi:hypothetical protein
MNTLVIPLAYKYVAIAVMLVEINFCAGRLQLMNEAPITVKSLNLQHVANPYVTGFGGTLETTNYSFVFFEDGKLRRIQRINKFEKIPLRALQLKLYRMPSLINTNEAYQLATNWLSAISVDVLTLEQRHPHSVIQKYFYPDSTSIKDLPEKRKKIALLPIFHVFWGDEKEPAVMVSIFGPTKEMLGIYQNDDSFSLRPAELVKDADKLLAIQDEEFLKYSDEERSNLVVRFSAVNCSQTNAPAETNAPAKQ